MKSSTRRNPRLSVVKSRKTSAPALFLGSKVISELRILFRLAGPVADSLKPQERRAA